MRWSALVAAGLLWLAPAEAKLKTPRSRSAASHANITPRAKHMKTKKFKPTGHAKAKKYSGKQIARRRSTSQ